MTTIRIGQTQFKLPYEHLLPPLTSHEYAALKSDILKRGVLVPVVVDEKSNVIDGQHRLKIAAEAGMTDVPFVIRPGLSPAEKMQIALNLNVNRRHLSKHQLRELATKLRRKGLSFRQIAEALGVSRMTVARASPVTNGTPARVLGRDGKRYPSVIAKSVLEARKVSEAFVSVPVAELPTRMIDLRSLSRVSREVDARERNGHRTTDFRGATTQLLFGDFRDKGDSIKAATVDLIFTDPPYGPDALPLWADLGRFAARVLKPGGVLASYSGLKYLPVVLSALSDHLEYVWTCAVNFAGGNAVNYDVRVRQFWKPVLLFAKPPVSASWDWFADTISGGKEKREHAWQQPEAEAEHFLRTFCPARGLVVDPCLGSGTTAVVAKRLGLRCVGIECDPVAFAGAVERSRLPSLAIKNQG